MNKPTTEQKRRHRRSAPSLRPPTLMIDLLFGALMLFAFQMGDPNAKSIVPHDIELPTDEAKSTGAPKDVLALVPISRTGKDWLYELNNGLRLSADEVAKQVQAQNQAPVLLLSKTMSVQMYIDAETPLRSRGLKVGLAVTSKEGTAP